MGGKKKKGKKGKKGKKDKNTGPPKLVMPNFIPFNRQKIPIAVYINRLNDLYLIYSDEYDLAEQILTELSKITKKEITDMRLYFSTRRLVDPTICNHDQQIIHNIHLFLVYKDPEMKGGWEDVKNIINYDIYDLDLQSIKDAEQEERRIKEEKEKEEEEKKKKEEEMAAALFNKRKFHL